MKNSIKTALLFLLAGFLFGACEKEDGGAAETPLPAGAVEVRGTLIDIRTFAAGKEAFPQQSDYIFDSDIETLFDTPLSYATGLLKARGATWSTLVENVTALNEIGRASCRERV